MNKELNNIKQRRLKDKVLFILDKYPPTRNCDAQLTFQIIQEYMPDEMFEDNGKWFISTLALKKIREDNVKRVRCIIQNKEKRFLPTEEVVRKKRSINEETWLQYIREENLTTC